MRVVLQGTQGEVARVALQGDGEGDPVAGVEDRRRDAVDGVAAPPLRGEAKVAVAQLVDLVADLPPERVARDLS